MEQTMLVRLKAHEPKKGLVLKQYTYRGVRFQAGRGWYKVSGELAAYLANVHSVPGDPDTPLAFDVRTLEEARALDENDRKAARQVLPAEEPLDVSHVGNEPSSVKGQRSTERNDATRQQRQPGRPPEDEASEDETPRRRAPRPRSQVEPRRRPREDKLEDADEFDVEDAEFDDDVPRRRARRSRTEVAPRRRARAAGVEDFDALDEDEFDAEDDEFDDDEEYLQAEPPLPRRRVEAMGPRHRREYDADDDAPARRSQRHPTSATSSMGSTMRRSRARRRAASHTAAMAVGLGVPKRGPWTPITVTTRWTMLGKPAAFEGRDRPRPSPRSGIAKHAARGVRTNTRRCPLAVSTKTRWNASSMMSPPRS